MGRDRPLVHWILLLVLGQLSIRALIGGTALLLAPSGRIVGLSTTTLAGTPFKNYIVPGLILLVAFGVAPSIVSVALHRDRRWGWVGAVVVGFALIGWILVEVALGFERPTLYVNLATAGAMIGLSTHPSVRQSRPADAM